MGCLLPGSRAAAQDSTPAKLGRLTIDTLQMRIDASVLADDSMKGRATGSPGAAMAAAYIEHRLRRIGLQPLGNSFGLTVPLLSFRILAQTTLELRSPSDTIVFEYGRDFLVDRGGRSAFQSFNGDVVFLGAPDHAAASATRLELDGRVIAFAGSIGTDALGLEGDWVARGVAGIVQMVPDTDAFAAIRTNLGADRLVIDAPVEDAVWQSRLPRLIAGPRLTRRLLRDAATPDAMRRGETRPGRALDAHIALDIALDTTRIAGVNVAGVVPGSDPDLAHTYVAFAAHYDHLGAASPDERGDSIYNGFTDNAAGVAMLLGIARAVRDSPPERSLLFLFFTGEERGLLGSTFFASEPPVSLEQITALINLDGGAPPRPPVSWRIAGGLGTPLGEMAARMTTEAGWQPNLTTTSPNSDHWPFLYRGVPSLFLIPGPDWEATTAAEHDALLERWDHYHQPADAWTPDYPFAGIARYAHLAARIGLALANRSHPGR